MSKFAIGNIFLAASFLASSLGQVFVKKTLSSLPADISTAASLRLVLTTGRLGPACLAGLLIVTGFACWLLGLQKVPLSYAYPLACGSALAVALFSAIFLGETVTWRLWVGTVLIAIGAAFVVVRP